MKFCKSPETDTAPILTMDQCAENTKSYHTWERRYLLEFAVGCPSRMGELLHTPGLGELLNLPWDPTVLLQARPVDTRTMERRDEVGVLVWH